MSRIVIDARMYNESGVGRYLRNLIDNLTLLDKKNEYFVLHLDTEYDSLVYHNKNFHKIKAGFRWYGATEQIKLPGLLSKLKPDLVHFPHFNVPFLYKGKFVVTIHDLIHQHFIMSRATTLNPITYKVKQIGYKKIFKHAISKSEKILVPSEYVKNLLADDWKISREKVLVTYEAVDERILKFKVQNQKTLNKFGIKQPYIFYVGNAHPHKNVEGLIKAFLELRKKYQYLQLVLSGNDHYFWQKIKSQYQNKDIIYTGFISDEELVALYKSAKCFVLPSFEEGFGIPVLEAQALGCPVVSSDKASLKEVGGDAAVYFNPRSIDDLVNNIMRVLNDDNLQKKLIEKGLKRVKNFSWRQLAKQTLEVYKDSLAK